MTLDASIIPFPVSAHLVRFSFCMLFVFHIPNKAIFVQMSTVYAIAERVSYFLFIHCFIFINIHVFCFVFEKAVDFIKEDSLRKKL
jgi:hypothetical protein